MHKPGHEVHQSDKMIGRKCAAAQISSDSGNSGDCSTTKKTKRQVSVSTFKKMAMRL